MPVEKCGGWVGWKWRSKSAAPPLDDWRMFADSYPQAPKPSQLLAGLLAWGLHRVSKAPQHRGWIVDLQGSRWSGKRGSNPRPSAWEARYAYPTIIISLSLDLGYRVDPLPLDPTESGAFPPNYLHIACKDLDWGRTTQLTCTTSGPDSRGAMRSASGPASPPPTTTELQPPYPAVFAGPPTARPQGLMSAQNAKILDQGMDFRLQDPVAIALQ